MNHREYAEAELSTFHKWVFWVVLPLALVVTVMGLATFVGSDFPRAWLWSVILHISIVAVTWLTVGVIGTLLWVRGHQVRNQR